MITHQPELRWLWIVIVVVVFVSSMTGLYVYAVIPRFSAGMRVTIGIAFRLAAYKIHITVLQLFTLAALCVIATWSSYIDVFFIFSGFAYVNVWYVEYKIRIIDSERRRPDVHRATMAVTARMSSSQEVLDAKTYL